MAPRSRHSKSASVASSVGGNEAVNGGTLAPSAPGAKSATAPATSKKPRSARSTTSPPGSPVVVIPKRVSAEPRPSKSLPRETFKFVAAVVLSTILEAGLHTGASMLGTADLAGVSKNLDDGWNEVLAFLAWKFFKLVIFWFGGFDVYDVASVVLLLSTPQTMLLGLFYKISPSTLTTTTLATVVANALPYLILRRPISPGHAPSSAPKASLRNRSILTDLYTTVAISLLATAIFAVLLEASFATFLPQWLVTHFTGLRTLDPAHRGASALPILLLSLLPTGVACMTFLFAPSTATPSSAVAAPPFDPVTATFRAHLRHNAWGWYTDRQKTLIRRTSLLAALMVTETLITLWATVAGVDIYGALGYAGMWGSGVLVVGAVMDWVGGPSD